MKKIYYCILILLALILILLPIIKIPITSSSRGIVRAQGDNTSINSIVSGRIIKSSLKQNNQAVKKGDTLLVITSEQIETQKQLQSTQESDYLAQLSDLNKLVTGNYSNLQTGQYQKELSAMREHIAQVKAQLNLADRDYSRTIKLYRQGVIPAAEYDKFRFNKENLERQIASIRENQIASWQAKKREIERQIQSLSAEGQRLSQESKNYIIIAPISGRITNFSGVQMGNNIIQGQEIATISPDNSLIVETYVLPKDIGFVSNGQKVKFQMDTYNYNQWGLVTGKVYQIDQNPTINQQTGETFFRVLCTMDQKYLHLKNGYKGNIEKGMTLTARFYLIERTLWQLLFDRVDDWFNPRLK